MDTEAGRELLASDLRPLLYVVTGKDKAPIRSTMWVAKLTREHVLLFSGDVGVAVAVLLTINPDGTLQDNNTGEQVHIWEYLGEVEDDETI